MFALGVERRALCGERLLPRGKFLLPPVILFGERLVSCKRFGELLLAGGEILGALRLLLRRRFARREFVLGLLFTQGELLFTFFLRFDGLFALGVERRALFGERLLPRGKFLLPPVELFCEFLGTGTHFFIEGGALFAEFFLIALLDLIELCIVVKRGEIVQLIVLAFAARHAGSGLLQNAHVDMGRRRVGEVKILIGDQAVNDGTRILPFRLILLGDRLSGLCQAEIFSPAAAHGSAPIGRDIAVLFQTLQGAVKGGLL